MTRSASATASLPNSFISSLADRYQAPTQFVSRYLEQQGVDPNQYVIADEWLSSLSQLSRFYTDYALSTNQRARSTVDDCIRRHGGTPTRHLDIGAGQGGLVREFAVRGIKSAGVEIDKRLYDLATANVSDVDADITNASILEIDHRTLGQFDIITCTEVIEHVHNPEILVERIQEMLAPGGILFLRMPNNWHVDAVRSDGHFLQFGIALLTREEAKAYKAAVTGIADSYEHMGEYYRREYYASLLERVGLQYELHPPRRLYAEIFTEFCMQSNNLMTAFAEWRASTAPRLPFFHRQNVEASVSKYLASAFQAYADALVGKHAQEFILDYCVDFWPFWVRKPY